MSSTRSPGSPNTAKVAWLTAAAIVFPAWQDGALSADERQAGVPPAQVSRANARRDPIRDAIARLSEHEIKAFYVRCSQEGVERKLDGSEAMICSIGYDVLLNKHFAGNFDLLRAWSRAQQRQGEREAGDRDLAPRMLMQDELRLEPFVNSCTRTL